MLKALQESKSSIYFATTGLNKFAIDAAAKSVGKKVSPLIHELVSYALKNHPEYKGFMPSIEEED